MTSNFEYYRIFYYVAKYGNLTRAASALNTSQPAVTRTIHKLEDDLGCRLFIRSKMGMELTAEGKALHHCVGGYIRDMAEEKTAIFFLRKVSEPDKPFYTLELQKKRVIQCRTEHNASYDRNPDVKNFVDMWMEKVVLKGKKKAKEAAA